MVHSAILWVRIGISREERRTALLVVQSGFLLFFSSLTEVLESGALSLGLPLLAPLSGT